MNFDAATTLTTEESMGDKGGKKDKEKANKQKQQQNKKREDQQKAKVPAKKPA